MSISGLFIRRPVATTLVMLGILMFGLMSYRLLPVSDLPNVDFPTISVSTSSSTLGGTNITLQFSLSRNIDGAAQDVQAAISKTLRQLPPGIQPPSYNKSNPADSPILYLALTSATLPLPQLDEYAETFLAQRLTTVSGVAQVQVFGSAKYAVRIQVDPKALAARGIGLDEVTAAVSAGNPNLPTGTLWGPQRAYTVLADGSISSAPEFRQLAVTYQNGAPVRLQDVANVIDDVQDSRNASWYDGKRAVVLAIQRQPGTNTVQVADGVKATVASLSSLLPASVEVNTLYDRSVSIRQSVNDVQVTLFIALILVVLVIFLFLKNLSATVIPSLALPFSIIGTFSVMYLMGYSLDNLSLMALTLAVGFVVDDAIVMLENIVRHMEKGKPALQAALDGAREIGFTILSMTLSLTAVFIPLLLMGGILGRLFHEFAVTIGVAILVSGFVSLTLTPMLCSRFLRPPKEEHHGRWYEATERVYQRARGWYERSLAWVMDRRGLAILFSLGILAGTAVLYKLVPSGFIPTEDTGQIQGTTETLEGSSFENMRDHQLAVADIVARDPNVAHFMSTVGGGAANQGRLSIRLKPRNQRPPASEVAGELNAKLNSVPGIRTYLQIPPSIRIGGRPTKTQYQFTLQSADIDALYDNAANLERVLRGIPTLQDVTSDLQIKNPQVSVRIDRDRATALGVTVQQIEQALYDAKLLYLRSQKGTLIPLTSVASASNDIGPLSVNHSGQLPSVTLSFNLPPGVSLGTAVNDVQKAARQALPSTISTGFSGTAQAFQDSQQGLFLLLLLAIVVIYIVLGILYESFVHPLTILSGLPFAGFGALLTLVIFRTELSVYAYVGVIMLVGLVKKNAIMMIDFALDAERREGKSPRDAIIEACSVRFRPIMMTTMAALMGTLPIAIGWGAGAESRRPLGLAVVGGLAFSQLITLYVTPVVYTYLDTLQHRLGRRARRTAVAEPEAAD
ncbi:MAG: acriflavine resistance protein B [Gemmatimonadetes bacterium]|nr:MAG: acriflavine resistance protein B [Gemmatimonadota bacterium]